MNRERVATYAQIMIIALAASVIYSAPYLRQLFKTSLLEAFSLTEAQLGNLSSTYALACLICYIPGGGAPIASRRANYSLLRSLPAPQATRGTQRFRVMRNYW